MNNIIKNRELKLKVVDGILQFVEDVVEETIENVVEDLITNTVEFFEDKIEEEIEVILKPNKNKK